MMEHKSEYFTQLSEQSKARYEEKLTSCGLNCDPYAICEGWEENPSEIPDIAWSDLTIYMVSTPSLHTKENLKAWKGMMDGKNFMSSGWVHNLRQLKFNAGHKYLVMGKVKHSQRTSGTPLIPWCVIESSGTILAAHCTCMSGLGEACSHVAAIITCLIQANESRQTLGIDSCTSKECAWLPPAHNVAACTVGDLHFPRKKRDRDRPVHIEKPSQSEIKDFYESINGASVKPAILKLVEPYAEPFIPKGASTSFPKPIAELYCSDFLCLPYHTLLKECQKAFDSISVPMNSSMVRKLEEATKGQASNKLWFLHRAGRITASQFKAVCHTNPIMPSQSLIKKICYPEAMKFSNEATKWGVEHEDTAIASYKRLMASRQHDLNVEKCGLFVHPEMQYLAASPDGLAVCPCIECQNKLIVLEVKCPYSVRDGLESHVSLPNSFCLTLLDSEWILKKEHAYYYQIQLQMFVCKSTAVKDVVCDFIVWTTSETIILRIEYDHQFVISKMNDLKHFYINNILTEIVGKWITRKPITDKENTFHEPSTKRHCTTKTTNSDEAGDEDDSQLWCFYQEPSYGEMILCDNKTCTIKWFHLECLNIRGPPKGKWYCPSCCKLSKFKKGKNRKKNNEVQCY